jgi:prephenate dehydrogenase
MKRVAIFGVGLIGGSFALALRAAGFEGEIVGVSSPATIATAVELGVIEHGVDAEQAVEQADFIYLAQPISTIVDTLATIGPKLRAGTLITDAGSTKKQIVEQARASVGPANFVGGHPMAGKERSGVREADARLFQGRPYVLTPAHPGDDQASWFLELREWIGRMGARPIVLEADQHDRVVAFTSHMPQLLSTALASVLADVEGAPDVAGPAVLELTRLALSPFGIWRDILITNDKHVEEALSLLVARLQEMRKHVGSRALEVEFERAATSARNLRQKLNS